MLRAFNEYNYAGGSVGNVGCQALWVQLDACTIRNATGKACWLFLNVNRLIGFIMF